MSELVLLEWQAAAHGRIALVTLNRPERHNSLVPELLAQLLAHLQAVAGAADARAVVLQAAGRSFSTGGDALGFIEHADNVEAYARHVVGLLNETILALWDLPVPSVAAVQGIVTGGSLGLILATDLTLLAHNVTLAPYYSDIGPSPDGGWTTLLPLVIGRKRAAEALLLNRPLTASEAVDWGVANHIVPAEQVQAEALQLAQAIAAKKPGSIARTRRLLALDQDQVAAGLAAELDHFVAHIGTAEALDGFRDFVAALRARRREEAAQ